MNLKSKFKKENFYRNLFKINSMSRKSYIIDEDLK